MRAQHDHPVALCEPPRQLVHKARLRIRWPAGVGGGQHQQNWETGAANAAHSLLRYINAVICSEIRPIMKVMTLPVYSSALMLVKRP